MHKWHARNDCVRLVKGLHEQYQALPCASMGNGPLTLLESIAKVPDRQVAKTGKLSIFWLSSFFFFASARLALRFKREKWHKSLGTALTTYRELSTRTILQWFSSTPMLILSAVRHFVRITLFIACMTPAGSSTKHVLDMAYCERWRRQQPRSGGTSQNIDLGYACFQEKYCIARAAAINVNENVCEDSHAEHL